MRLSLTILFVALAAMPASGQQTGPEQSPTGEANGSAVTGTDEPAVAMTSPPTDEVDCSELSAFAAQREAFLEQEPLDDFVYIRRIDVSVCGYEGSNALIARLNALPPVRAGLEHMQIDPDTIVSARWTDDRGLMVYTAEPE